MTRWLVISVAAAALPSLAHAQAQPAGATTDIEVPTLVLDQGETTIQGPDEALDLANIVQSAAKGVTTVQEAPAIVTVVTADEIKDRQFQNLEDLVDTVPGWYRDSVYYSNFPTPLVRGQIQAVAIGSDRPLGSSNPADPTNERIDLIKAQQGAP